MLDLMAQTVSPIRREGRRFTWTHWSVECDGGASGDDLTARVVSARYRTDDNGRGVWVWRATGGVWVDHAGVVTDHEFEWHQLTGWSQFNLNCSPSTRRERVLGDLGFTDDDGQGRTAREMYARTPRIPPGAPPV